MVAEDLLQVSMVFIVRKITKETNMDFVSEIFPNLEPMAVRLAVKGVLPTQVLVSVKADLVDSVNTVVQKSSETNEVDTISENVSVDSATSTEKENSFTKKEVVSRAKTLSAG